MTKKPHTLSPEQQDALRCTLAKGTVAIKALANQLSYVAFLRTPIEPDELTDIHDQLDAGLDRLRGLVHDLLNPDGDQEDGFDVVYSEARQRCPRSIRTCFQATFGSHGMRTPHGCGDRFSPLRSRIGR